MRTTKTTEEKRAAKTEAQRLRRAAAKAASATAAPETTTVETVAATTAKPKRASKKAPAAKAPTKKPAKAKPAAAAPATTTEPRDPRLPAIGTTHERVYLGKTLKLEALADGTFRFDGEIFKSVSGAAKKASGAKTVDGFLWWRLNPKDAKPAKASEPKIGNGNDLATPEGQRDALAAAGVAKPRKRRVVEDAMAEDNAEAAIPARKPTEYPPED